MAQRRCILAILACLVASFRTSNAVNRTFADAVADTNMYGLQQALKLTGLLDIVTAENFTGVVLGVKGGTTNSTVYRLGVGVGSGVNERLKQTLQYHILEPSSFNSTVDSLLPNTTKVGGDMSILNSQLPGQGVTIFWDYDLDGKLRWFFYGDPRDVITSDPTQCSYYNVNKTGLLCTVNQLMELPESKTLYDAISTNPHLTIWKDLIDNTPDIRTQTQTYGDLVTTFFAPNDDAMTAYISSLNLKPADLYNEDFLRDVFNGHISVGALPWNFNLGVNRTYDTGDDLNITVVLSSDGMTANVASDLAPDTYATFTMKDEIMTGKAFVQILDAVLTTNANAEQLFKNSKDKDRRRPPGLNLGNGNFDFPPAPPPAAAASVMSLSYITLTALAGAALMLLGMHV